jgi:porin
MANGVLAAWALGALIGANETAGGEAPRTPTLLERESLSDGWFGLGAPLAERGFVVALSVTQVFQANARGGLRTRPGPDQWPGSYDLEIEANLEKALRLPGGRVYALAEGSWRNGLNDTFVGALQSVNADAAGSQLIALTELWCEQALFERHLIFRIGKLNLPGGFECRGCPVAFDKNSFANSETAQFLNAALVNNPTIPFPQKGLGAAVHVEPLEWLYVSAGVADANADARENGFNTTFSGPADFFSIYEAGVVPHLAGPHGPLPGAYRVGLWYDPRRKARFSGGEKVDDLGVYASFDQMLWRENADEKDQQGIGAFGRIGWADEDVNEMRLFWSAGAQWRGMVPGRDADVLALGLGQGWLSREAGFSAPHETVVETYYSCEVAPWLHLSPSVQVIVNPGGSAAVGTALVVGLRAQVRL